MTFRYRPEIDGLRAIAVFSVILFHAGLNLFKGGFVGVDVFFVISGYLITSIILTNLDNKDFSTMYFYERRARRILPTLIVTIFFSLIISFFLFSSIDLIFFSKSVISSLTFWSNLQFHNEADYFAKTSEFKPLLHTWSLSIEEQFYIVFPLIILFFISLKKKFLNKFIIIVFFISLLFSQWSGNLSKNYPYIDNELNFFSQSDYSSFFMPFGRIWEISLGAICAIILKKKLVKYTKVSNLLSFTGFILVFFSIFFISANYPFPSFYTLIPTIGTALVILFSFKETFTTKILSFKYFVYLGLLSYSLYLFHFPIFVFLKYLNIEVNSILLLPLLTFIIFISFLNWNFIEKPMRKKNIKRKKFLIFVGTSYIFLIIISFYVMNFKITGKNYIYDLPVKIQNSLDVVDEEIAKCIEVELIKDNFLKNDFCFIGNKNNKKIDFVIYGDSHILTYHNIFNNYLKKSNKKGLFIGYPGCPPIPNIFTIRSDESRKNCRKLNDKIFQLIKNENISNLVHIARWSYYTGEELPNGEFNPINNFINFNTNTTESKKVFEKSVSKSLEKFGNMNLNLYILEQPPFQNFSPSDVYLRSYNKDKRIFLDKLSYYSIKYSKYVINQVFSNSVLQVNSEKHKNIHFIKISDIFCKNKNRICKIGNENYSFYYDRNHLNEYGAKLISERVISRINE